MWTRVRWLHIDNPPPTVQDEYQVSFSYAPTMAGTGMNFPILELGGAGIFGKVVFFQLSSGTSTVVTGLGFQPGLIFLGTCEGFQDPDEGPPGADFQFGAHMSHGVCDGSLSQWGFCQYTNRVYLDGGGHLQTNDGGVAFSDTNALVTRNGGAGAVTAISDDGFTITHNAAMGGFWVGYAALEFGDEAAATVGTFAKATGTGNQDITGLPFSPDVVYLMGVPRTTFDVNCDEHLGAYHGFFHRNGSVCWSGFTRNNHDADHGGEAISDTEIHYYYFNASKAKATHSMLSNGFRLNWSLNDGIASKLGYVAYYAPDVYDGNHPHFSTSCSAMWNTYATIPSTNNDSGGGGTHGAGNYNNNVGWGVNPSECRCFAACAGHGEEGQWAWSSADNLCFDAPSFATMLARLHTDPGPISLSDSFPPQIYRRPRR